MTDNGGKRLYSSIFYVSANKANLKIPFSRWSGMRFRPQNSIQQVVGNEIPPWVAHFMSGREWKSTLGRAFRGWSGTEFHLGSHIP